MLNSEINRLILAKLFSGAKHNTVPPWRSHLATNESTTKRSVLKQVIVMIERQTTEATFIQSVFNKSTLDNLHPTTGIPNATTHTVDFL